MDNEDPTITPAPAAEAAQAPAPAAAAEEGAKKGAAYGTILGIVLIVGVLVVGAFYVWGERLQQDQAPVPANDATGSADIDVSVPQPQ